MDPSHDSVPYQIEAGPLLLALPQPEDCDELVSILSESDEIARWTTIPFPYLPEHFHEWLARDRQSYIIRCEGRIIGVTGAEVDPATATAELGYWLAPSARGAGYAVTAARAVCSLALDRGAQRIQAKVIVGNLPSSTVLDRLGFTLEGVQRSVHPVNCGISPERIDLQMWSLLPGELT
ncbi:MAG: GNAT family N-acetyltransferase [Acidimicrobiales bacterium]|nr:GNAT family N-acetyltransferase [Acidimicrobiales bacterium]